MLNCRYLRMSSAAVAAFLIAGGASAQAQEAPGEEAADKLGEIIVTAQKRSERLQDAAMAISAMQGEQLADRRITDLTSLQQLVPNLNVSQRQSAGVVTIRGVGFAVTAAGADGSVAVYGDGVYFSRPAAALTGFYDIARVEVARGPQGTLYGRNSTGGAVNVITNSPTEEPEGYLSATIGNYGALSFEGAVSGPIVPGKLMARLSVKSDSHTGYGRNLFDGSKIDDLSMRAARLQFEYLATDTLSFRLIGDYLRQDDAGNTFHGLGPSFQCNANCGTDFGGRIAPDPRDVDHNSPSENEQEYAGLNLTAKLDLGAVSLTSITAFRKAQFNIGGDLDTTSFFLIDGYRLEDEKQFSQEFQLAGNGDRFNWVLGAFYFSDENEALARSLINQSVLRRRLLELAGTLKTDAYAAFGEATFKITPELSITGGLRYSYEKRRIENERFDFISDPTLPNALPSIRRTRPATLDSTTSFDSFSPKVSLNYKPSRDLLLYASVQKGVKSGGFAPGSITAAFAPEKVTSYEGGVKATWFDGALLTNIAVFHYDYTNLQQGFVVGSAVVIGNAASAKVDGVDVEARLRLGGGFSLDLAGGYLDARYEQYCTINPANPAFNALPADPGCSNANPRDFGGNPLANAPKWSGNFGAEYVTDAFGGEIKFRGEIFASSKVIFTPFNLPRESQAPYELINAFVTWKGPDERISVSAFMRNITDKTVLGNTLTASALFGSPVIGTYLPPRTFGMSLRYNF